MENTAHPLYDKQAFEFIALDKIAICDGFNPRTYFDQQSLAELAQSIKTEGVIQPIILRHNPDKEGHYFIVAGERRYRASLMTGLDVIPAIVRELDENSARVLAILENFRRENISPMEEAEAARKVLDCVDGDRNEAARQLGWSHKVLDNRLLLLHCAEPVKQALNKREILLGHAELLSPLPEKTQTGTLKKLTEEKWSVPHLKERVSAFLSKRNLTDAVFDTQDCQTCPHNTSQQAELFAEHVSAGCCGIPECWANKTTEWLNIRKKELETDYSRLYLDLEKDPATWEIISVSGEQGVGQAQLNSCKACDHYGAIMSSQAGKEGTILSSDVCFNLTCLRKAVKTYQISLASHKTPKTDTKSVDNDSRARKIKPASQKPLTPKRILDFAKGFLRRIASEKVTSSPTMVAVYSVLALKSEAAESKQIEALEKKFKFLKTRERGKLIKHLFSQTDAVLEEITHTYVASIAQQSDQNYVDEPYLKGAKITLACLGINLTEHFVVNEDFLKLHTKGGLMEMLRKTKNADGVTFARFFDQKHGKGNFARLEKLKHPDIVNKIISSGYNFKGFLPKYINLK